MCILFSKPRWDRRHLWILFWANCFYWLLKSGHSWITDDGSSSCLTANLQNLLTPSGTFRISSVEIVQIPHNYLLLSWFVMVVLTNYNSKTCFCQWLIHLCTWVSEIVAEFGKTLARAAPSFLVNKTVETYQNLDGIQVDVFEPVDEKNSGFSNFRILRLGPSPLSSSKNTKSIKEESHFGWQGRKTGTQEV